MQQLIYHLRCVPQNPGKTAVLLIASFTSRGGPESIISPLDFEMLISDLFGMTFDAVVVFTLELDFFLFEPRSA